MKKILVTGGAGFIGSNLVDALVDHHEVTVWDNLSTGKQENVNPKAKFQYADVAEYQLYTKKGEFDVIFHLAALARIQPSFNAPIETHSANVTGTARMLEMARNCGAKFIYPGSSSFYHDPLVNPYSFSKWLGEEYCKLYTKVWGVPTAIARFFNVYGKRHLAIGSYATVVAIFEHQKKNNLPLTVTGTGAQRRDFTHVNDIVSGLIAIMDKEAYQTEKIYNFGTGINHSILELARMFKPLDVEFIEKRPGEAEVTLANVAETSKILCWTPQHSLEDYVKNFVQSLT